MKDYVRELFKETYEEILDKLKEEDKNHKYLMVLKDIWELKLSSSRMNAYLRGLSVSGDYSLYHYYNIRLNITFKGLSGQVLIINLYNQLKKDGIIN